jgi:2,3,4,5-tetrahydropyridine-2-carboxylate N-succinyltransferase
MSEALQAIIEKAWDERDGITINTGGEVRAAVVEALGLLDSGQRRVAAKIDDAWQVNQWLKKAVLLSFRLNDMEAIPGGPGGAHWWDKVPSKFAGWGENRFRDAGFRAVPGSIVRHSAHIGKGVVLMPSFVNLGPLSMRTAWSIPGPPWAAAPRSAKMCTCRAASGSAGFWNRCRRAR